MDHLLECIDWDIFPVLLFFDQQSCIYSYDKGHKDITNSKPTLPNDKVSYSFKLTHFRVRNFLGLLALYYMTIF